MVSQRKFHHAWRPRANLLSRRRTGKITRNNDLSVGASQEGVGRWVADDGWGSHIGLVGDWQIPAESIGDLDCQTVSVEGTDFFGHILGHVGEDRRKSGLGLIECSSNGSAKNGGRGRDRRSAGCQTSASPDWDNGNAQSGQVETEDHGNYSLEYGGRVS